MSDINETCEGCVYAHVTIMENNEPVMRCRRYPPQLFVQDGEICQAFPDAWRRCGEYQEVLLTPKAGPIQYTHAALDHNVFEIKPGVVDLDRLITKEEPD